MKNKITKILILLWFPLLVSCESFIYHPDSNIYVDPYFIDKHPEEVFIKTEDQEILHGWIFRATNKSPSKNHVIVQFHGNAMNMTAHFMSLLWLTDQGYDLFTFDYRGFGLSSGEPTRAGTHLDAKAVLDFAHRRFVDKEGKRLIVYGQSLGGAVSMRAIGERDHKEDYTIVVADGSFASYKKVAYQATSGILFPLRIIPYFWLSEDEFSPGEFIPKISPIPLFVVHGDDDRVISFENGQEIYDLAKSPRVFFHVHHGGHVDWMQQGQSPAAIKFVALMDRVVDFTLRRAREGDPHSLPSAPSSDR